MYDVYYSFDEDGQVYQAILTSNWKTVQINVNYIKKWRMKRNQVFLNISNIVKRDYK